MDDTQGDVELPDLGDGARQKVDTNAQGDMVEVQINDDGAAPEAKPEVPEPQVEKWYKSKSFISNFTTFVLMVIGLAVELNDSTKGTASRYLLSFGLFGFAGGITNWIAITMLFDEIPFVIGSGIIPKQVDQIKLVLATMIMDTFFAPEFLKRQLAGRTKDLGTPEEVKEKAKKALESEDFDKMLDAKLESIQQSKSVGGMVMKTFNISTGNIKPMLKKFITSMANDAISIFLKVFNPESFFDGDAIVVLRRELDELIKDRMQELTASKVTYMLESIIRSHLGWLVVWGNVFGAIIGVISTAAGY